jgi:hypothetical protein
MTLAKAKDYFSAYYEGSLDRGLKQAFETRLREDAKLQAEYRAFVRTMKELEAFGCVEVEPPSDLHDKIAARLDKAIWEQKRQKAPALSFAWWKGLVGVSVAAALVILVISVTKNPGRTSESNPLGIPSVGSANVPFKFAFSASADNGRIVTLSFPSTEAKVSIKDASGKLVSDSVAPGNQEIQNGAKDVKVLNVEANSGEDTIAASSVAVPGTEKNANTTGKGTVKDLAIAIAGYVQKPVVIQNSNDGDKAVSWDLTTNDWIGAATGSLKGLGLSISESNSGVILIQANNQN